MACFLIKGLQVRQSTPCYSQKALASSLGEWGSAARGKGEQRGGGMGCKRGGNGGQRVWGIGIKSVGNRDQRGWGMGVKNVGNGGQSLTKNACKSRVSLMHRHHSCCLIALLFNSLVVKQQRERIVRQIEGGRTWEAASEQASTTQCWCRLSQTLRNSPSSN